MAASIPFLWTNDDVTVGQAAGLEEILAFLARWKLPGTFFVVPRPGGTRALADDATLISMLKSAMSAGHEAHQHSTTHACEENGTADLRMYDLMGMAAKQRHATDRFLFERLWQPDAIAAQIDWGRRAWSDALGTPSRGFRPGCGAFCTAMYAALESLGFQWVSSRLVSLTGWQWVFGNREFPVQWDIRGLPIRIGKLIEFPIIDDVAFRVPEADIDRYVGLGWQHWTKCVQEGWPFILVSHPFALRHEGGTGFRIHEKLIGRILDSGRALPMSLNQYHDRIRAGEFAALSVEEVYPMPPRWPQWHVWGQPGASAAVPPGAK